MKIVDKIWITCFGLLLVLGFISTVVFPKEGATGMVIKESGKQKYLNGEAFASEDMYTMPEEIVGRYTREGVIKTLNESFKGGTLQGMGDILVQSVEYQKYDKEHNVDVLEWSMKIAAIMKLESRTNVNGKWIVGTSWNSVNLNNICGMNRRTSTSSVQRYNLKWNGELVDYQHHGRYTKYPSITESMRDMVYWIKVRYIMNDLDSIAKIHLVYAPLDDPEEGKNGMSNFNWSKHVTKFYNELVLRAEELSK